MNSVHEDRCEAMSSDTFPQYSNFGAAHSEEEPSASSTAELRPEACNKADESLQSGENGEDKSVPFIQPLNPFILFCAEKRSELTLRMRETHSSHDITRELARMWKSLRPHEKAHYKTLWFERKEEFHRRYPGMVVPRPGRQASSKNKDKSDTRSSDISDKDGSASEIKNMQTKGRGKKTATKKTPNPFFPRGQDKKKRALSEPVVPADNDAHGMIKLEVLPCPAQSSSPANRLRPAISGAPIAGMLGYDWPVMEHLRVSSPTSAPHLRPLQPQPEPSAESLPLLLRSPFPQTPTPMPSASLFLPPIARASGPCHPEQNFNQTVFALDPISPFPGYSGLNTPSSHSSSVDFPAYLPNSSVISLPPLFPAMSCAVKPFPEGVWTPSGFRRTDSFATSALEGSETFDVSSPASSVASSDSFSSRRSIVARTYDPRPILSSDQTRVKRLRPFSFGQSGIAPELTPSPPDASSSSSSSLSRISPPTPEAEADLRLHQPRPVLTTSLPLK
eukprot:CAMPEP_0196662644 /NCGR_PEP_ID=MMETSP1086-20130531/49692_1 /TAXON_ID=77921 /ORGANISM="Cyanoptyche  gloeocystis , Strain SAG4.97" /LENGTH=504 /DNA_ID=CAMNT_0041998147 /DNA_START=139 /DNA_END=1652 /DNA_ORIENTATION=+